MQLRTSGGDGFRTSVLSTPICSSGGSGPNDIESLGDVYVWGEVWSDEASSDDSLSLTATMIDMLIPKLLESNVVLDVQQIACGVQHVALVTRQVNNVDFVTCGEHHSCAVSISSDLFTWGDALATASGKLFTFGDGSFGVLGHGNRESFTYPKGVQSLGGLKTIKVACGVWHTAAIVEVTRHSGANMSSRKLFSWDDALTTSGNVFNMGSTACGKLGNPNSDGKLPCLVQDKLVGEFVEEISCGHIMLLF
ncbi:hypothetical protein Pint_19670 [Pistacia integerrima]|uniref:Uncharacterized protein n=1 Tax=Pistacia integerrima TaxID=434235 RepID=A0ACC0XBL1_9ROSI|nr:hypothetical protein Pint_19670 [Pistacia integerrima]